MEITFLILMALSVCFGASPGRHHQHHHIVHEVYPESPRNEKAPRVLTSISSVEPETEHENNRERRSSSVCTVPTSFQYYHLDCVESETKTVCNQTCLFGFTLPEGIRKEMSCIHKENKWTPDEKFEECRPFVDCKMTHKFASASSKCEEGFLDKGAVCNVFCALYEPLNYTLETESQVYECDIEGRWTPNLPYCVYPGIGSAGPTLVPVPSGPRSIHEL